MNPLLKVQQTIAQDVISVDTALSDIKGADKVLQSRNPRSEVRLTVGLEGMTLHFNIPPEDPNRLVDQLLLAYKERAVNHLFALCGKWGVSNDPEVKEYLSRFVEETPTAYTGGEAEDDI